MDEIKISNLNFSYKANELVLKGLNLNLRGGNIYGLFGKNGEGKTTLLHCLMGLCTTPKNTININGKNVEISKEDMYFTPEDIYSNGLSIREYTECIRPFYKKFDDELLKKQLDFFNIDINMKLNKISLGQKKKANVSIAFASKCSILIFDEPTNGLDVMSKKTFRKSIIENINEDRIIIISTHQVRDLEDIVNHILVLNNHHLVFDNSIDNISNKLDFLTNDVIDLKKTDIIYSSDNSINKSLICKKQKGLNSKMDLELLLEAISISPESINKIFNQ